MPELEFEPVSSVCQNPDTSSPFSLLLLFLLSIAAKEEARQTVGFFFCSMGSRLRRQEGRWLFIHSSA